MNLRKLSPKQQKRAAQKLGLKGEQKAAKLLQNKGYWLIGANFIAKKSEIDLVAYDPQAEELVFVEVKTRKGIASGDPSRAVNWRKIRSMEKAARAYVRQADLDLDWRFDIISVLPAGLWHYENVTWFGSV